MKKILLFVLVFLVGATISNSETIETDVVLGSGYENRIFFAFPTQVQTTAENSLWHIAFQTSRFDAGLFINDAIGVNLYHSTNNEVDNWDSPVTVDNLDSWDMYYNENNTWNVGAFNRGNDGFNDGTGDYGWGAYDPTTHLVLGTTWYVLQFGDTYKKIMVDSRISNEYTMLISDLDGGNEEEVVVPVYDYQDKLLVYFNLESNEVVDIEPLQTDWDIVFTRYIEIIDMGGQDFPQGVTGVKNNFGVASAFVVSTNPYTAQVPEPEEFMDAINAIGYDWKTFDLQSSTYDVADDRAYFIRSLDNNIYKIVFKEFEGSTTGRIVFDLVILTESVDRSSIDGMEVALYPNIVNSGDDFNLVLDSESGFRTVDLSIVDMLGNIVLSYEITQTSSFSAHSINIGNLSVGVYYALVNTNGQRSVQKFIVR